MKRKLKWDEAYTVPTEDGDKLLVPFTLEEDIYIKKGYDGPSSYSSLTFFIVSKQTASETDII